ncbi:uncharacterized protein [Battus philenor]|uniref:uncharacterized protein n=1 Tax=Battus philenor TaxID=42288 RepID=UPI0035CEAFD5
MLGKDTSDEVTIDETLSCNARSKHSFPRNPNFENFVHKFETVDIKKHPKCNLKDGLSSKEIGPFRRNYTESVSSLDSISSLEWDDPKGNFKPKSHRSLYFSVDNLHRTSSRVLNFEPKPSVVKVTKDFVPVFKVESKVNAEFVDSQEFNEDNYLDISNSFSTENQTIVENKKEIKDDTKIECSSIVHNQEVDNTDECNNNCVDKVEEDNISVESLEGEYHSFHDDIDLEEGVYDSPVKKLMEKDIRDYSVPMDIFYSDYRKNDKPSHQSPKKYDNKKVTTLEPILEESKSLSDESNNISSLDSIKNTDNASSATIENSDECSKNIKDEDTETCANNKNTDKNNKNDISELLRINGGNDSGDNDLTKGILIPNPIHISNNEKSSFIIDGKIVTASEMLRLSYGSSLTSSETGLSLDSTAEFEKLEIVSELLGILINRVHSETLCDAVPPLADYQNSLVLCETQNDNNESIITEASSNSSQTQFENFSIMQIVKEIECCESTDSTNSSGTTVNIADGVVEAIIYYIFDTAFYKATRRSKQVQLQKRVITVVDSEDILYTTTPQFLCINVTLTEEDCPLDLEIKKSYHLEENHNINVNDLVRDTGVMEEDIDKNVTKIDDNDALKNIINADLKVDDNIIDEYLECDNNETQGSCDSNWSLKCYCNCTNLEISDTDVETTIAETTRDNSQEVSLNETFVLTDIYEGDMNTAFVEDKDSAGRSSSPRKSNSVFDNCTESPIRNTDDSFHGSDLSVLYEKDNTLLGSPFVRQTPVLPMSLTQNRGGIKYWLSFDDSTTDYLEKPLSRSVRRFEDAKMPSFVSLDVDKKQEDRPHWRNNLIQRPGVLAKDFNLNSDSFNTASPFKSVYNTCESSIQDSSQERQRLLYDSRANLKTKCDRLCTSWPPYEETVFYRIISKFRMSESFDPNSLKLDKSL